MTKKRVLKGCISRWKTTIICLQKTKMEEISVKHIKSLWRGNEIGWNFLLAKGTAGGILIM